MVHWSIKQSSERCRRKSWMAAVHGSRSILSPDLATTQILMFHLYCFTDFKEFAKLFKSTFDTHWLLFLHHHSPPHLLVVNFHLWCGLLHYIISFVLKVYNRGKMIWRLAKGVFSRLQIGCCCTCKCKQYHIALCKFQLPDAHIQSTIQHSCTNASVSTEMKIVNEPQEL